MRHEQNSCDPAQPRSRGGRIVLYVFLAALLLFLVVVLFNIILSHKPGEPASAFGYSIVVMSTKSMEPTMPSGTAVLVRQVNPATLQPGDVVAFRAGYGPDGKPAIDFQRVVAVGGADNPSGLQVRGDRSDAVAIPLAAGDVFGKCLLTMPGLGKFLAFLKTTPGLVTCLAIPLVLLFLFEVINLVRLARKPDPFEEEEEGDDSAPEAPARRRARYEPPEEEDESFAETASYTPEESGKLAFLGDAARSPVREALPGLARISGSPARRTRRAPADLANGTAEFSTEPVLYHLEVPTEQEEVPLERPAETIDALSYRRPEPPREDESELYVTQEFVLPPTASDAREGGAAPLSREGNPDFEASVAVEGRDSFKIEGIAVKVKPDALNLALAQEQKERDICITVTNEYTNVTVGSAENEVRFALFRDDADGEQKVIIQKKNK